MIIGADVFIKYIKEELNKPGFSKISIISDYYGIIDDNESGILIEFTGDGDSKAVSVTDIPVIYPFDFIEGAGVIVVFPEDNKDFLSRKNLRLWAAEYISGYCAFWNVKGSDWLHDALPAIKENKTSDTALRTAAYMCVRIAANIAVGREVKHYPRFYLAECGECRVESGEII